MIFFILVIIVSYIYVCVYVDKCIYIHTHMYACMYIQHAEFIFVGGAYMVSMTTTMHLLSFEFWFGLGKDYSKYNKLALNTLWNPGRLCRHSPASASWISGVIDCNDDSFNEDNFFYPWLVDCVGKDPVTMELIVKPSTLTAYGTLRIRLLLFPYTPELRIWWGS